MWHSTGDWLRTFQPLQGHWRSCWKKMCHFCFMEIVKEHSTLWRGNIAMLQSSTMKIALMCDVSDSTLGVVLGQRKNKYFHPIAYASKTMNTAQEKYTTTEKELLAVVFAHDKFWLYLLLPKVIIFSDHATLKFLMTKAEPKLRLIRWILLLQEFNVEINDRRGTKNKATNHLSWPEGPEFEKAGLKETKGSFLEDRLYSIHSEPPWYADIVNFIVTCVVPNHYSIHQKRKLTSVAKHYFWDDLYLFKVRVKCGFYWRLSLKMHVFVANCVTSAKGWAIFVRRMKCPKISHCQVRSLTFEV